MAARRRFVVTPTAQADVRGIIAYLRPRSRQAAKTVRLRIYDEFRRLADFPQLGHPRDDVGLPGVRFWRVYSYLIVYRPDPRPIEIVRVLHGARDLPAALGD